MSTTVPEGGFRVIHLYPQHSLLMTANFSSYDDALVEATYLTDKDGLPSLVLHVLTRVVSSK